MFINENSTNEFMCNTQYRSSYYNGIAFLWKSAICCDLTSLVAFMFMTSKRVFIWTWSWSRNLPNIDLFWFVILRIKYKNIEEFNQFSTGIELTQQTESSSKMRQECAISAGKLLDLVSFITNSK